MMWDCVRMPLAYNHSWLIQNLPFSKRFFRTITGIISPFIIKGTLKKLPVI
jgi:hypothetical protein